LPKWDDPRIRLSVVIISLQVLGQTVLRFKLSIAQILVSISVCALVEIAITGWRQRMIVWPASAILTGNSTAFILRANGTRPGDWWSLNGIEWFALAALVGILSKYLIRIGDRHMFNPSNLGLVMIFLVVGARHVFPQYLYWGPVSPSVLAALAVILAGAMWVLRPLRMWPMVVAFLLPFAMLVAVEAFSGRCFLATWHRGPVCGSAYWLNLVTSPELLVFVFFMISDPKTAPRQADARIVYGVAIALLAAGLLVLQPSEFGIKVAILAALTVVCALVPLMDRVWSDVRTLSPIPQERREIGRQAATAMAIATFIALATPPAVIALASDRLVVAIDGRGSPPSSITRSPAPADIPEQ
jgi:Na+-translocating ferredoxin:NAD+ oxidoreductase RnfD subunit